MPPKRKTVKNNKMKKVDIAKKIAEIERDIKKLKKLAITSDTESKDSCSDCSKSDSDSDSDTD